MEQFIFGLKLTVIGMSVVYVALTAVMVALNLFKLLDRRSTTPEVVKESVAQDLSPEIMAAISAAVAVAIGKKATIKRIYYRNLRAEKGWANQGRTTIMASHTISKR